MKRSLVFGATVALALAMSGCGVDVPSPGKYADQAKSAAAEAEDAGQEAAGGALGGDPNAPICADGGTPGMRSLGIGLQLLAQPNIDFIVGMRNGEQLGPVIDIDGVNQGIQDYRVLDGHPATGYKDPKVALDHWQEMSDLMGAMIDGPSDPTQADIDAYTTALGDQQEFIFSQMDVAIARDFYCGG